MSGSRHEHIQELLLQAPLHYAPDGLMEDLDGVTVFLASRASDYITGQVIPLDGGYSAK